MAMHREWMMVFSLLLLIGSLSACTYRPTTWAPWQNELFTQGPEGASTMFQKGWRDGCETGISMVANDFQRQFYTYKQDSTLVDNKEYYIGWSTARTFCQRYVFQYLRRNIL